MFFRNAEGEEYLQQRRLQLPFNCSAGEGILYNAAPTIDVTQFQFNKIFSNDDVKKDMAPASLLDCFLNQDESIYTQTPEKPLSVDQVFMDSRALFSVASSSWKDGEVPATTGEPVMAKEEDKHSVMAMIDTLEKLTQNGEFDALLQNLQMDGVELMEWENSLKRTRQEDDQQSSRSDVDAFVCSDIFDYIDNVFKEKMEDNLTGPPPSCLTGGSDLSASQICEPQIFQTPTPDCTYSPANGLYSHQQGAVNGEAIRGRESAQMDGRHQKLSHQGPQVPEADGSLPPLQQLQLQDIFSPSVELPELTLPDISAHGNFASFQSCQQAPVRPAAHPQVPALAGAGPPLQRCAQQQSTAPGIMDVLPPLIPCNNFSSPSTSTAPVSFPPSCLQETLAFKAHNSPVQQWPQSQQQKLPHAGVVQGGQQALPAFKGQNSESQTFPSADFWQSGVNRLNPAGQGGLAGGPAAAHSSCMYQQRFSSGPAGGSVLPHTGLSGTNLSLDQSPPQGSCYFQWSRNEPVVGSSAISQEAVNVSPLTAPPGMAPMQLPRSIEHYLDSNAQTQVNRRASPRAAVSCQILFTERTCRRCRI